MNKKPFLEKIKCFSPAAPVNVRWRYSKFQNYPSHYHPEYEFQFVKRGYGVYVIEGKNYDFQPGYLIVIRPHQVHSYFLKERNRIEKIRLQFKRAWLGNILEKLRFDDISTPLICLTDKQAIWIETILNRILDEHFCRAQGWEDMIRYLVQEFLILVHRARAQTAKPARQNQVINQLRRYIEIYYADPNCTVTAMAKHFGYSLSYLSALFKGSDQHGIKNHLLRHRVEAAQQLIKKAPALKITAIARQVGFNRYANFHRSFRRHTGLAPMAYRKFYYQDHKK